MACHGYYNSSGTGIPLFPHVLRATQASRGLPQVLAQVSPAALAGLQSARLTRGASPTSSCAPCKPKASLPAVPLPWAAPASGRCGAGGDQAGRGRTGQRVEADAVPRDEDEEGGEEEAAEGDGRLDARVRHPRHQRRRQRDPEQQPRDEERAQRAEGGERLPLGRREVLVQQRGRRVWRPLHRLAVHGVDHLPLSTRVATLARVAAAVARRNGGEDGRMYARGDGHLAGGDGGDEGEQARDGEEEEGDERLDVLALRRARRHRGLLGRKQQLGAALARARVADVAGTVPARVRHSDGASARDAAAAGAAP
mmetsp:Transcript_6426/g.19303  ORF Transcript_6426/g.19303 Transcript_6426/m.19303 type:complete len:311 (-) Transcript_6426:1669-2601(-)